jgi:hypothetical protein
MPKIVDTKERIIKAGVKLAGKIGTTNITRRNLAEAAGVTESLVTHHVGNVDDMRKLVKREARKAGVVEPDKAKQEAIGVKLRAHGPRKVTVNGKSVAVKTVPRSERVAKKSAVASTRTPQARGRTASKAPAAKKSVGGSKRSSVSKPASSPSAPVEAVLDGKLAAEVRHHAEVAHVPVVTAAREPKAPPIAIPVPVPTVDAAA